MLNRNSKAGTKVHSGQNDQDLSVSQHRSKPRVMLSFLAFIARKLNLNLVLRWLNKIPKYKKDVWWNRSCHMRDEKYPKVFYKDKRYIDCKVGNEVIMGTTKIGEDILYKVIKVWRTQGSDWLYDTDAYSCNLKFSRVVKPKN